MPTGNPHSTGKGSALGPKLVSVFTSGLEGNIKAAADTKVRGVVNNAEDGTVTLNLLDHSANWAHSNKMCFDATKCNVVPLRPSDAGSTAEWGTLPWKAATLTKIWGL